MARIESATTEKGILIRDNNTGYVGFTDELGPDATKLILGMLEVRKITNHAASAVTIAEAFTGEDQKTCKIAWDFTSPNKKEW